MLEHKPSWLRKINDGWQHHLERVLPNFSDKIRLSLQSARSKPTLYPSQIAHCLYQAGFSFETSQQATALLDEHFIASSQSEGAVGAKVIDPETFQHHLETRRSTPQTRFYDLDQKEAVTYWVNHPRERYTPTLSERIFDRFLEAKVMGGLALTQAGACLKTIPGVGNIIGESLIQLPIQSQMMEDLLGVVNTYPDRRTSVERVISVGEGYGIESDNLGAMAHPEFITRIKKSAVMTFSYYLNMRSFAANSTFWGLVNMSQFSELLTNHPTETIALGVGLVGTTTLLKMITDRAILASADIHPDVLETTAGLVTGHVDSDKNLKANPNAGLIGAPFDLICNWTGPWAWPVLINAPAHLFATAAGQTALIAGGIGYLGYRKIANRSLHKV